jgi:flagellar biosynthesis chaperone FliJ
MKQFVPFLAIGLLWLFYYGKNQDRTAELNSQIQQLTLERNQAKAELNSQIASSQNNVAELQHQIQRLTLERNQQKPTPDQPMEQPKPEEKNWLQKRINESKPKLDEPAKRTPGIYPRYWVDQFGYRHYY